MEEDSFDLDLNRQPVGLAENNVHLESGLVRYTEPETTREVIIDRMRHLEAVTYRDQERRRWRESAACSASNNEGVETRVGSTSVQERMDGMMKKTSKRDSSYLVAKALGIDPSLRNKGNGGYYGCNVCFNMAREPVLTCCGHLFCWLCFYNLPYIETNTKECPVCSGEVKDSSIIPIYGSGRTGGSQNKEKSAYRNEIPPRPHAHRIQSLRQQLYNREEIPFERVRQHFTDIIGIMEIRSQTPAPTIDISGNQVISPQGLQSPRIRVARVVGQGIEVEPYASVSFALNETVDYVGRLLEGTQADLYSPQYLRISQETLPINDRDSSLGIAASVQPENQTPSPSAGLHFRIPLPSGRRNTVVSSMNETIDPPIVDNLILPSLQSSRGRSRRSRMTPPNSSDGNGYSSTP